MSSGPPRLLRSSATVGAGSLLSRLTGLLRTVTLVGALGTTGLADAYNVANNVPNIVYELVAGGVLSAALIPLFVERLDLEDTEGISAVISVAIGAMVAATLAAVLCAPLIARLLTLFQDDSVGPEQRAAITSLLRWFLPQILLYGVISLLTALLNARRSFGVAAFAPAINNVVVSAMFLCLPLLSSSDLRGPNALANALAERRVFVVLGLGTTLGVALSALVLFPALVGRNLALRPRLDWRNPTLNRLLRLSSWTVAYAVANQLANFVVLPIAYRSGDGAASAYFYAYLIFVVPHGLLAGSVMTTLTPELARSAQSGDRRGMRKSWTGGLRMISLLVLPASAGLTALAYPLVSLLPGLASDGARRVAGVLVWYAPGLFAYSVFLFGLRPFYALGDTRTPFMINLIQNVVHIVLALILGIRYGVEGLAATHSLAYSVGAVLAFSASARRLGRVPLSEVRPLVGMAASSIAMATVVAAVVALLGWGDRSVPALVQLAVAGVIGVVLYPLFLGALGAADDIEPVLRRLNLRRAQ